MAFIFESIEIRKFWPQYNRSQKRFEQAYALYNFEDQAGYSRLAIEKKNKNLKALYSFNLITEGHGLLRRLMEQFELCPKLCHLQHASIDCINFPVDKCKGACKQLEPASTYNDRVTAAIIHLENELPSFALVDTGLQTEEQSCVLIEKGKFYGMGYLPADANIRDNEQLKNHLTPYAENDYIRGLIYQHAMRYPSKKISF